MAYEKPPYAPNVVNQTVSYGGATWKGNPGSDWVLESAAGGGGGDYSAIESVPSVQEYIKGQFATEDVALKNLLAQMRSRQSPLDIYSGLEETAGLPMMKKTATTLMKEIASIEDYLDMIEPDVSARTRESLATEAQRRAMVAAGKKPWIEKLSRLGTSLGRLGERIGMAERGIGTKTELAMRAQEMNLEPYQLAYSVTVDRNARMLTGFTEDRQAQLDILWDKLQRQRQLEDREWELAQQLAAEERQYFKNLQAAAAESGIEIGGNESAGELLALIGKTAKEAIDWERSYKERALRRGGGGGTAGERATAAALVSLRKDVLAGATFEDVMRRYASVIPTYKIREEYNAASRYGPAKESESQVEAWFREPEGGGEEGGIEIVRPDGSIVRF